MVETERIRIFPLTHSQLLTYLKANDKFELEMGLARTGRNISGDVKDLVENFTLPNMKRADDDNYLFYTFWIVIDKSSNSIVAELGFKGVPNRNGEIEIGYGTMPGQQGKGYMSEAVSAMIRWASSREDVSCILAETDQQNYASVRVVTKNGFEKFDQRNQMLWWKKMVNK